jgi:uncharacterized membrane protein YcjF (UPF0283 family)
LTRYLDKTCAAADSDIAVAVKVQNLYKELVGDYQLAKRVEIEAKKKGSSADRNVEHERDAVTQLKETDITKEGEMKGFRVVKNMNHSALKVR